MELSQIVSYVLLGLFVISAFFGFLFGLGRGLKKATLRLVFFVAFAIISMVITPYVSTLLLDFPLEFGIYSGSLSEIINQFIAENAVAQSIISSSEVLQQFVQKLPLLIINLVMFLAVFLTLNGIGWMVYAIFASIFIKKNKYPEKPKNAKLHVELKPEKPKKHRFLGGLVGAVQGVVFLALLLVPVTGFLSIANSLTTSTQNNIVYAEDAQTQLTPTAALLDEFLPQEAKDVIQAYRNSPVAYVSRFSGADTIVFDSLTTIKIQTETDTLYISYRNEIYSLAKLYDNVEFLRDIDFDNITFSTLEYNKLESAVDTVLSSKLLLTVAPELLDWAADQINLPPEQRVVDLQVEEQFVEIINTVVTQYRKEGTLYSGIRNDLKSAFKVARAIGESGIADELMKPEIDLGQIKTLALANQRKVVNQVTSNLFDAISLRTLLVGLLNNQLDQFTATQDQFDPNRVVFEHIHLDKVVWSNVEQDMATIVNNLIDMYESLEDSFTSDIIQVIEQSPYELLNADVALLTQKLGQIMTTIQNSALFVNSQGQKVLHGQLMDYLNNTPASEYVDFVQFKVNGSWATEMNNLSQLLTALKDSGVISLVIDKIDTPEDIDISEVIHQLASQADNHKTYTHNIVSPILNSLAFRKMLNFGFDYLDEFIEKNQHHLGTDVLLGKIQSQAILQESEKVHVLAFFDNIILYADELDIDSLGSDAFSAIINSNFTRLGLALDSLKASALFGPYTENGVVNKGIYVNLIEALANNNTYNQFASFEVALEQNFTWNSEFAIAQDAIAAMKNIKINFGGTEKNLIQAIVDGEDLLGVLNVLTDSHVDSLIWPVISSRLLSKNIVTLVNTMNQGIEQAIGIEIDTIPYGVDISAQTEDIKLVIKKLIAIYPQISDGIDSDTIADLSTQIGTLMNAIKANAQRAGGDGVFKNTYDAVIEFFRTQGTFGEKFAYIMDSYDDPADMNWETLLSITVDVNDLISTSTIPSTLKPKLAALVAQMFQEQIYGNITSDVINILNQFVNITSSTGEDTVLSYVSNALGILASSQNQYVLDNASSGKTTQQLKVEYSQKVDRVLAFFQGLTGIEQFDALMGIEDYEAEQQAIQAIDDALQAIEDIQSIEDLEQLVVALADSDLIMQMLEQNNIEIEIAPEYHEEVENFINTNLQVMTNLLTC